MTPMRTYNVHEITTSKDINEFHRFPVRLYKGDSHWVQPLTDDIEKLFDPRRNKLLRHGQACRWLLKNTKGETVGRIAAFIDPKSARKNEQPTGGMGFFECIDNQEAANHLFNTCKEWLQQKGMEAMDGPINFGERDSFWGCLVEGFHDPIYNMPYNFAYYKNLFENYGFENYFNQYTYHRKIVGVDLQPIVRAKAERIFSNPGYQFKMINWDTIDQFAQDFMVIFNKAWAQFPGVKKITPTHAMVLLNQMKPIMDERLVYFAYYEEEPIAFFIMMPDLNQIIKKLGGKLNWWTKILFFYHLKIRKSTTRIIGRIFGIVPEHQGRGVEAGLVLSFEKQALKPGFQYTDLELNWIGDFNPTMMKVCEQIGGKIRKTHITFRYLFDRTKPFKRARKVN